MKVTGTGQGIHLIIIIILFIYLFNYFIIIIIDESQGFSINPWDLTIPYQASAVFLKFGVTGYAS